jgi:hypothetical protein
VRDTTEERTRTGTGTCTCTGAGAGTVTKAQAQTPHTNPPQLLKVPHGVFAVAVNEPKFGAQLDNVGNAFKVHLKLPLHIRVPRDVQETGEARGW